MLCLDTFITLLALCHEMKKVENHWCTKGNTINCFGHPLLVGYQRKVSQ